jgi:RHS repeat-associated protein
MDTRSATPGAGSSNQDEQSIAPPRLSLPKGGGAIRGIGEKFSADPITGTASFSVPIYTSPGRSGSGPQLTLSYGSGSGNSPFGFGWSVAIPSITRKTDKGLPQYRDADESDIFMFSGAGDLLPALVQSDGQWIRDVVPSRTLYGRQYAIHRYRPRVESLFAQIERWINLTDATDTFWRCITRDNLTSWYGSTVASRIADPNNPTHIFQWNIDTSYDDRGNAICYQYKAEDSVGVDTTQIQERNRSILSRSSQQYIKNIFYGNRTPYFPDLTQTAATPLPTDWCFQIVFDYGEHDLLNPVPQDTAQPWPRRLDPFSTYRPTFEVRTYRLCRRVLMFHDFTDAASIGTGCFVRSTDLTHLLTPPSDPTQPFYSYLLSATQSGYVRNTTGGYDSNSLPPVEFTYTQAVIDQTVRDIDPGSLRNLPYGLDGSKYRWVDLDGEGVSGFLTEQDSSWYYKANLTPANVQVVNGQPLTVPRFAGLETVASKPSLAAINAGRQQLIDLSGDGRLDLVQYDGTAPGYFERTEDFTWKPFVPFQALPVIDWRDPNLRFIDLTGDGFPDLLICGDNAFSWYASLSAEGFAPEQYVPQSLDEEKGPKLVFADSTESIFLADMSGDGLVDLVRVRVGEVCYWPNCGYGLFGAKVTMGFATCFDNADLFDGRKLRLQDIDGSGTADIVYFSSTGVDVYFNQSGNAYGARRTLSYLPQIESVSSATLIDLLGNGTACLVWSSALPINAQQPMRYIDLMGGQKPHLLIDIVNNLGAETQIQYAPSTKFYVADKLAGTPWITRLPFPVQVVEQVDTYDYISQNRLTTCYTYHHGYYDGVEREFRGFGRVDQWDTELVTALTGVSYLGPVSNENAASVVPPMQTITWFHTGVYVGANCISQQMQQEYYSEGDAATNDPGLSTAQFEAMQLPDTVLPTSILLADGTSTPYTFNPEELREACRSLRGSILRQEIYALDASAASDRPYSVSERNYAIEALQPQGPNQYGVFFAHQWETIDLKYERELYAVLSGSIVDSGTPGAVLAADPRVSHSFTLAIDGYGNELQTVSVGYGRRHLDPALTAADQQTQTTLLSTYTEHTYTNAILTGDSYRTPIAAASSTYQLVQFEPAATLAGVTNLFQFNEVQTKVQQASDGAHDIAFEDLNPTGLTAGQVYRRVVTSVRTYYRPDDMGAAAGSPAALLALGTLESLALPGRTYKAALTPGLITQVLQRSATALLPTPATVLGSVAADGGGFVDLDGDGQWWAPSGRIYYAPAPATSALEQATATQSFYLPQRFEDAFGNATTVSYDAPNYLLPITVVDALVNTVSAVNDYRVLAPSLVTDANGNRTAASFDILGMVTGTAVMGKITETLGDSLTGFSPDLTQAQIDAFWGAANPATLAAALLLGTATTRIVYGIQQFYNATLAAPTDPTKWVPTFVATIARETHESDLTGGQTSQLQISFSYSDGFGREIQKKLQAEPGPVVESGPTIDPRWVGSGWTIFNNKGKPVRQYEPFFSQLTLGHQFEFGVTVGVSPILCYDPVGRVVATIRPNQTYDKVVFDPWHQLTWDVNDTVLIADPTTDPDVGDFFTRLPPADYSPTWYTQRATGGLGAIEQAGAAKAKICAATPSTAYFDPLGRTFLTIANNGPGTLYSTHTDLDISGQQRSVTDANRCEAMLYDYDMLGMRIHQSSMEAGQRWMLNDVLGKSIRSWDSRGHNLRTTYDQLRRPTGQFVLGTDPLNSDPRTTTSEVLVATTTYGESQPTPEKLNLRTRVYQQCDTPGVVTNAVTNPVTGVTSAYDFKGNLLCSSRGFVADYKNLPDLTTIPATPDVFNSSTAYDALNRPIAVTTPDRTIALLTYNLAGLLENVTANVNGSATATPFVTNISYNARGQRLSIQLGNNTNTAYVYDSETFRVEQITTSRSTFAANQQIVQDLAYTYDPIGNILHIQDDADIQDVIFFRNVRVEPSADYTYDPIYRLIGASGRELLGLSGGTSLSPTATSYNDIPRVDQLQPGDGNAMGIYSEQYLYDPVGNFLQFIHRGTNPANPGWSRAYTYNEPSLLEPAKMSNRLSQTAVSGSSSLVEQYTYDLAGSMTSMSQLQGMAWDFKEELIMTQRQAVNSSDTDGELHQGQRTYYLYDSYGQRVRKTTESSAGVKLKERLYLAGYELYRKYTGGSLTLECQTLHVMDDKKRVALLDTTTVDANAAPSTLPRIATRYQFDNHLGTACLELDETGALITYEEYYPFGGTSYQAGATATEVSLKRYRYNGRERDEESGLYYYGWRYYASWLGRWTACDPTGIADGPNIYLYVSDNPVRMIDRNGTQGDDSDDEPPVRLPAVPEFTLKDPTKSDDNNKPQVNMPNFGLTNPAWQAQHNPVDTLTTDFTLSLPFQSSTDPKQGPTSQPSLLTSIRGRTSETSEWGAYGAFGSQVPLRFPGTSTGTGSLGASYHFGPAPPDDGLKRGFGWWQTLGQVWGLAPQRTLAPPGWTFNPNSNSLFTYSWQQANKWDFDVVAGFGIGRWGQVNGVSVGAPFTPFAGLNYARNLTDNDVFNFEGIVGGNFGLGGREDLLPGPSVPRSLSVGVGIGYQHTWGDYGIGIEPYFFGEPTSDVASPGGHYFNFGGGLRFDFAALNAKRSMP